MAKLINGILDEENDCIYLMDEKGNVTTYYSENSIALFNWETPEDYGKFEEMTEEDIAELDALFGTGQ